ncbi:MAG: hypothetical protein IPK23_15165 [Rhizobiales bacterium]|nr:hypothetical protein [Hyphomicrobiales bacterium]
MGRIDAEENDLKTLAAAGNAGVVASLGAGLLDPTIFLPAGAIYRSARGGYDILRTARSFMLGGISQAVMTEAVLQGTHETYGFSDAAFRRHRCRSWWSARARGLRSCHAPRRRCWKPPSRGSATISVSIWRAIFDRQKRLRRQWPRRPVLRRPTRAS